jgi:hypothetical protein
VGSLCTAIEDWAGDGSVASLSAFDLASDLSEIEQAIARLEAERAARLLVFEEQRAYESDGAPSAQAWLVTECRMAPEAAALRLRIARRLPDLPATVLALRRGDISFEHVRAIETATRHIEIDADDEALLLHEARRHDGKRFAEVAANWRHRTDAARCLDDAEAAYRARTFGIHARSDGIGVLTGQLDPEGTATVATAVDALAAPTPGDTRTAAQRRADALVELCRRALDGEAALPTGRGERPHLTITMTLESLEARAGVDAAMLDWSGPIPGATARRLACDASVCRIITDGESQPLDVGRRTRPVPPAIRRAVVVRDRHCVEPGCDAPAEWCDVHHIVHWIDGGATRLDNLELRCRRHHREQHEGAVRRAPPPPTLAA